MSSPRGFTLLELLLATVLSSMLIVGVLMVLTNLTGGDMAGGVGVGTPAADARSRAEAVDAWAELLRHDLVHATHFESPRDNVLTLTGYSGLHGPARDRAHRPVRVRYEVHEINGRFWLVREQSARDVRTNPHVQRDLVCTGVRRFEIVRVPAIKESVSPDEMNNRFHWRLRVWTGDQPAPQVERIIAAYRKPNA